MAATATTGDPWYAVEAAETYTPNDARDWLHDLRAGGAIEHGALADLHGLLLRAAQFEIERHAGSAPAVSAELRAIAIKAADEAFASVRTRLDDYRGQSRFTTWACKFALRAAALQLRRRAWRASELPLEPEVPDMLSLLGNVAVDHALVRTLQAAIESLTTDQRRVFLALAVAGVPIDVLAERLGTSRGALYETLSAARRQLRERVASAGSSAPQALPDPSSAA